MVWHVGLIVVTALLVLFGLREGVRRALTHELDLILREDLKEVRLALAAASSPQDPQLRDALNRKADGHAAHRWYVRFLDHRRHDIWTSRNAPTGLGQFPLEAADHAEYRVVEDRLPEPRGEVVVLQIGASTEMIEADLQRLDRLITVAVGTIAIMAPLCGYWLAGRALRPVAAIIDTAVRLRPEHLDERLPDRGTGDELDRLAATVNRLLDRIAIYVRERRDLLANSAHELRSPLAAIRSTVEVALASGRITPEAEETFEVVIDQCRSLEHLVNQLLLLAETEAEQLIDHSEMVPLDRLVTTAADMFSAVADTQGVRLRVDGLEPITVRGNRIHLRQVVNNLIDNAVKFTPPGGMVTISLQRNETSAVLEVHDTGLGIPPRDLPHVFDRFFRGDRSHDRDSRGTGLGLSICRAVVTAHGGTIAVRSCERGSTVIVELPRETPLASGESLSPGGP